MLTRRNFLKGLLSSVAAAPLIKNGVVQPEQAIAEPEQWTIDMGANTWRKEQYTTLATSWGGCIGPIAAWNRRLSDEEIRAISDTLAPRYAFWRRGDKRALQPVYGDVLEGFGDWANAYDWVTKPEKQPQGLLSTSEIDALWRQA